MSLPFCLFTYIYIYISINRKKEREREGESGRERGRESKMMFAIIHWMHGMLESTLMLYTFYAFKHVYVYGKLKK